MYRIVLKRTAQKDLDQLPRKQWERVRSAIDTLRENPFNGKRLHGDYEGSRSIRVWPYRIVYVIEKEIVTVTVLRVTHRQGAYKK